MTWLHWAMMGMGLMIPMQEPWSNSKGGVGPVPTSSEQLPHFTVMFR